MAGVSITQFVVDRATYTVGEGDEALEIVYRPKTITPDLTERFKAMAEAGDARASGRILREIVVSWNLTGPLEGTRVVDENGSPKKDDDGQVIYETYEAVGAGEIVPLDPEVLRFVPTVVQVQLWNALQQDSFSIENPFLRKKP